MKVILLEDVKGTGKKGEMREVSDGFAVNYLFKRKLAKEANASAINELKGKESAKAHHLAEEKAAAEDLKNLLNNKEVVLTAKAGSKGKLFGAVTSKEIAAEINNKFGVQIDKRKMSVNDIKNFGEYKAEIKLYNGIVATITVIVKE